MKITFKYITLSLLAGASLLTSCEDFLDREPLDSVTPDTYLKNESQLAAYAINADRKSTRLNSSHSTSSRMPSSA